VRPRAPRRRESTIVNRLLQSPRGSAAFEIRGLDRIGQTLPDVFPIEPEPIDDDLYERLMSGGCGVDVFERDCLSIDQNSTESFPAQGFQSGNDGRGIHWLWRYPTGRILHAGGISSVTRLVQFIDFRRVAVPQNKWSNHRQIESDQQTCSGRQFAKPAGHDLGGLSYDLFPALATEGPPDASEQETHVVVNLSRRAYRRSGIANAVLLPDRDGRRDAVDAIDVRLLHSLEELPGISGQGFHVPPLSLRVDGVEGQRRLARPADAGNDDELPAWKRDVDILEVVRSRAPDDEIRGCGSLSRNGLGHALLKRKLEVTQTTYRNRATYSRQP
jgi:hypothetical protein